MNETNGTVEVILDNDTNQTFFLTNHVQLTLTGILVSIVVIGILGNVLLITMLLYTKMYRANATSVFVLNLSCADLLFLIFCVPFQGTVYVLNNWPYGMVPCKTTHFFQYTTMFASIWLLMVMSIDRYFALKHPLKAVAFRTARMATRYSIIVWILACLVSTPWLYLYNTITIVVPNGQNSLTACLDIWPDDVYFLRKWLMLFIVIASFAFPTLVIIVMAWLVASALWASSSKGLSKSIAQSSKKAFKQRRRIAFSVFLLALLLFICWLPHNISLIWINFGEIKAWGQEIYIYKITSHMLSYVNSCINPFICYLMSRSFRRSGSTKRSERTTYSQLKQSIPRNGQHDSFMSTFADSTKFDSDRFLKSPQQDFSEL